MFSLIPSSFFSDHCKIIWMNIQYFPNAPRMRLSAIKLLNKFAKFASKQPKYKKMNLLNAIIWGGYLFVNDSVL